MKIYRININLRLEGYVYRIEAYEAEETAKAFKFSGKLIKKSLLNKIDTHYHNFGSFISYFTWSLGTHVEANKTFLLDACNTRVKELERDSENLRKGLEVYEGQKIQENF